MIRLDAAGTRVPVSVAPMMNRTDRHFRYMARLISPTVLLYTEMVTANALLHGDRKRHLRFDESEHPVVLQLGGDDPEAMAECARMAESWGYDEVNINVGCPSERVKRGNFGACLMTEPETVARCVEAMRRATSIPVSVKHRIGVDDLDQYDHMRHFVDVVSEAGADRFTVHARKAWLSGLSPKENRNVPPLRHPEVHRLKHERPDLVIETNGGITTAEETREHLDHVDAVMIGRAVYDNPLLLADLEEHVLGGQPERDRHTVVERMLGYVERHLAQGGRLQHIARHLPPLFTHCPGARKFRQYIAENAHKPGAGPEVLLAALERVPRRC